MNGNILARILDEQFFTLLMKGFRFSADFLTVELANIGPQGFVDKSFWADLVLTGEVFKN